MRRLVVILFAALASSACASSTSSPDAADFCPRYATVLAACGSSSCSTWTAQQQECAERAWDGDSGTCAALLACLDGGVDAGAE